MKIKKNFKKISRLETYVVGGTTGRPLAPRSHDCGELDRDDDDEGSADGSKDAFPGPRPNRRSGKSSILRTRDNNNTPAYSRRPYRTIIVIINTLSSRNTVLF